MTNELQNFIEQFYRSTSKIQQMRTKKLSFDGTPPLQTASIHFIEMIGKHKESNMTEFARMLGITKGSVSQMAKTLEEKRLIRRVKGEENDKDTYFVLTEEGRKIYEGHEKLHEEMYSEIETVLSELTPEDMEKAVRIFSRIESCMDEYKHSF